MSLRDTIKGHDRDTIRDTKIVSCPLIVSLKSRDTNFLKFVSLSLAQGHDPGTRHDRVPDKSMPVVDDFPFLSTASQSAFLPLGPCWAFEFPSQIHKGVYLGGMSGGTQQWGVRDQFKGHVKDIFEGIIVQLRCISHVFAHCVE